MKIRIKGNSIRLRFTKTEVANFAQLGYLEEATEFVNNKLVYAISKSDSIKELSAKMEGNKITLEAPTEIANTWTETEQVGFQNIMNLGNEKSLFLLVEKDFVCIDNTFEDQSDNYPNPNEVC